MTSRFFSLVAVPIALVGNLLFWSGSAGLLRGSQQFAGVLDVGALALTVAGIVVLLAAVATVAIGSLGAYVVGGAHLVFSLLLHLLPFDFRGGGFSPAFEVMNAVRSASMEVSDGMFFYFPPGIGAIVGVVFVGAALAADQRRVVAPSTAARLGSGLAGLIALAGLVLAIAFGARVYVAQLVRLGAADPVDVVALYLGVLLIGIVVAAARWSAAGTVVAGAVVTVVALIGLAAPVAMLGASGGWVELRRGLELAVPSASLLLIGVLLLVAGQAVRLRARRRAPSV